MHSFIMDITTGHTSELPFDNPEGPESKLTQAVAYSGHGLVFYQSMQKILKCNISEVSQDPVLVNTLPGNGRVELASDHAREILFEAISDYGIIQLSHSGAQNKTITTEMPRFLQIDTINQ